MPGQLSDPPDLPAPAFPALALAALLLASLPLALRPPAGIETPLGLFGSWTHFHPRNASLDASPSRDLAEIRARGRLRALLVGAGDGPCAPGPAHGREAALLAEFTGHMKLALEWVCVPRPRDLLPALAAGRGDLVMGYRLADVRSGQSAAASVSFAATRSVLLTRNGDRHLDGPEALHGRQIGVRQSSPALAALRGLQDAGQDLDLRFLPDATPAEALVAAVKSGALDTAVLEERAARALVADDEDVRIAFPLDARRPVAWQVPPQSAALRETLDAYLNATLLRQEPLTAYREDLPALRGRGVLRVLVREQEADYYLWRGELRGFEYELVRRFAEDRGLRVEVVVPDAGADPLDWLRAGRGDLVATPLSPHAPVADDIALTRPYRYERETLLGAASEEPLAGTADLAGLTVAVPEGSPHLDVLERLRAEGVDFKLLVLPGGVQPGDLLSGVAAGRYDLTVTGEALGATLGRMDLGVKPLLTLDVETPRTWATRQDQPALGAALNAFITAEFRGRFYNVVFRKHFKNPRNAARYLAASATTRDGLSPYDETVREYAERYGFDWRLIVAQMYQESRFDPSARSEQGAEGLLQLMPRTAPELGLGEISTPEQSIHAGVRYLAALRERIDPELPQRERTWFALAAYNAGYARLSDARRLAGELDLDPDRWFENVEIAMQRLPETRGYADRHRSCRCTEPVRYVQQIRTRYAHYARLGAPLVLSALPRGREGRG